MITKFNFYDGVPVGVREFQEFFDNIKRSANAALMFAFFESNEEVIRNTTGGYLEDAPVVIKGFETGSTAKAYVLSGVNAFGTLFIKGKSYFDTYEIPLVEKVEDIPTYTWDLLATHGDSRTDGKLYYEPLPNNEVEIPVRVIRPGMNGLVEKGLTEIRYNGIPQETDSIATYDLDDRLTSLVFPKITLGAEYPHPLLGKKYIKTNTHHTLEFYRTNFNSNKQMGYFDLMFPFSNFIIEGAIIILRRVTPGGVKLYQNVQEDVTPGRQVKANRFKVIDRARGIVRFNLTKDYLSNLKVSSNEADNEVDFEIICPEILMEEVSNNVVYYRSRYGGISYAASDNSEILRYVDGGNRLELIPTQKLNTSSNDVILYEKKTRTPSTILAVRYMSDPVVSGAKQSNKYLPDIITLFFSNGIITSEPEEVLGVMAINKTSWYNWDASKAEYTPINRLERANVGLISTKDLEYISKTGKTPIIFNPRQEVRKEKVGLSEWVYTHYSKRTLGVKNEFVRRDAHIPEPHHVNPVITKMTLVEDESLRVPEDEQMNIRLYYTVEGNLTIDGFLLVE